jgi:hypothetical protein
MQAMLQRGRGRLFVRSRPVVTRGVQHFYPSIAWNLDTRHCFNPDIVPLFGES